MLSNYISAPAAESFTIIFDMSSSACGLQAFANSIDKDIVYLSADYYMSIYCANSWLRHITKVNRRDNPVVRVTPRYI